MTEPSTRSIEERLAALEAAVEALQRRSVLRQSADEMAALAGAVRPRVGEPSRTPRGAAVVPPPRVGGAPSAEALSPLMRRPDPLSALLARGPQFWISRIGIGLLLVGVAFLFKYAVDQGWLTPTIRVAFGLALGGTLATIGIRVHERQRWFGQIMLGGAAATWYITGFAAFQLLHLVSFSVAFAFMVLVTVFTFWEGLRQDEAALAVLAAIGGLGTPFFLYTEAGSVPGLMTYTCLVLVGTSAIYLFKGWRSLLWTTAVGAWLVVALAFQTQALADRIALQAAIGVIWLLFWLVPVSREVLADRNPARWSRPLPAGPVAWRSAEVPSLVLVVAVLSFFGSRAIWAGSNVPFGVVALGGTAAYALAAVYLSRSQGLARLASAHGFTAAMLLASAIGFLFTTYADQGHIVLLLWAVEAAALHWLARRPAVRDLAVPENATLRIDVAGHLLYALVGFWLYQRLLEQGLSGSAVLNTRAGADAVVIALSLITTAWCTPRAALVYRLVAHIAILGWLLRELGALPAGGGIVTAAWGLYGLGLLFFVHGARQVGLGTMLLAVAKLVLFDLNQVEPVWRILLFLGFGGVFLAISYYFPALWSGSGTEHKQSEP